MPLHETKTTDNLQWNLYNANLHSVDLDLQISKGEDKCKMWPDKWV